MMALSTLVEYIKRPFRQMPRKRAEAKRAEEPSPGVCTYFAKYTYRDGVKQWCTCWGDGWPLQGHGENEAAAREHVALLNQIADERKQREREARAAQLEAIHQRRQALRLVKKGEIKI